MSDDFCLFIQYSSWPAYIYIHSYYSQLGYRNFWVCYNTLFIIPIYICDQDYLPLQYTRHARVNVNASSVPIVFRPRNLVDAGGTFHPYSRLACYEDKRDQTVALAPRRRPYQHRTTSSLGL